MVKSSDASDGDGDDPYRGVLDEWAREQARERDKTAEEGDNKGKGHKTGTRIELTDEERRQMAGAVAGLTGYDTGPQEVTLPDGTTAYVHRFVTTGEHIARLERENAAMREIAQEVVATMGSTWQWHACPFCGEDSRPGYVLAGRRDPIEHAPDCPVTKARALLAGKEGEGG